MTTHQDWAGCYNNIIYSVLIYVLKMSTSPSLTCVDSDTYKIIPKNVQYWDDIVNNTVLTPFKCKIKDELFVQITSRQIIFSSSVTNESYFYILHNDNRFYNIFIVLIKMIGELV